MIDLLYLAHNRLEFTKATFAAMLANTDWTQVRSLHVYDDASTDGTREWLHGQQGPRVLAHMHCNGWGGPVAIMNEFIMTVKPELFAKVDNDTMLPPGWLPACLRVLSQNPSVHLLGIEPMHPVKCEPYGPGLAMRRYAEPARYIGGIGLMRGHAFDHSLPRPDGRMGFTAWQDHAAEIGKAWINPALPVCLLDRMPLEPWKSLSAEYVAKGWQRPWELYTLDRTELWNWWVK